MNAAKQPAPKRVYDAFGNSWRVVCEVDVDAGRYLLRRQRDGKIEVRAVRDER